MKVDVFPAHATVVPGQAVVLSIQVFNSSSVISAHRVRVLGVDERWLTLDVDQLSLFPETSGIVIATISLPKGIPAGTRQLTVQVSELTPPQRTVTATVDLTVPAETGARIALDPIAVTGGKAAAIGVILENDGNADLLLRLDGIDEEDKLQFLFEPPDVVLAPGDRVTIAATLKARRPFAGSPKARTYTVRAHGTDPPIEAFGSFVQKPLLSRGALGLVGLLLAVSVFALVITSTFGKVVDRSDADRNLLLQVIQGDQTGATGTGGSVGGKVMLLTSGAGVGGVTVQAFPASNTATPTATIATAADGAYTLKNLSVGDYKLRFQGAGFTDLWYPSSITADNAKAVAVKAATATTGIDVRLGGVPGKLSGTVTGEDPTGATVSLRVPGGAVGTVAPAAGRGVSAVGQTPTTGPSGSDIGGALVVSTTVAADGGFHFDSVPSPSAYELIVQKEGFATEVQRITLNAGEERGGIEVLLRKGDGTISGRVLGPSGPLGGATITATDGSATSATVSLTQDDVGAFTLRNLPTPATFTVLVSKPGFATQTLTLSLAPAQQLTGVVAALTGGAGSIEGTVRGANGTPLAGVAVVATNGTLTLTTITSSSDPIGSYKIDGLAVPATYTITFSRADLASTTQAVEMDSLSRRVLKNIDAAMVSSTGSVIGTISEAVTEPQPGTQGVGEVEVVLAGGASTYRTRTATDPVDKRGQYVLGGIPPGTYSLSFNRVGAAPLSFIITVAAGQTVIQDGLVGQPASITGLVVNNASDGPPLPNAEVRLFRADQYPTVVTQVVLTNAQGIYLFDAVPAPQSYVLEYAYPAGSAGQVTRFVDLTAGEHREMAPVVLSTS